MKINDRSQLGVDSAPGQSAVNGPGGVQGKDQSAKTGSKTSASIDRTEVSSLASKIANLQATDQNLRAERVLALKAVVGGGRYVPDPGKIAKAIVQDSLSSSSLPGGSKE